MLLQEAKEKRKKRKEKKYAQKEMTRKKNRNYTWNRKHIIKRKGGWV
jgi:hypothetical protein